MSRPIGWSEERIERLQKLWREGMSASDIAAMLGGITRNAVIGKIHRLGWSTRRAPRRSVSKRSRKIQPSLPQVTVTNGKSSILARMKTEPLPPPAETDIPRMSLADLNDIPEIPRHCRFICGDPAGANAHTKLYCGAKTVPSTSYCEAHLARTFAQPALPERKRQRVRAKEMA